MLRYGPLFRTNILGSKTVVSTDPDVNFEILRQKNKSFILSYPDAFVKPLGKDNLILKDGMIHNHIKQITQHFLGSQGLKRRMTRDMDEVTREHLESKASNGILNVKGAVSSTHKDGIQVIKEVLRKRKMAREKKHEDFLDTMLEELEKERNVWNPDSAASLIFFLSFGAQETTSKATCLAVKFLSENPKMVAELKREHEEILESREDKELGITWEEYKHKIEFHKHGYTIPAGWIAS